MSRHTRRKHKKMSAKQKAWLRTLSRSKQTKDFVKYKEGWFSRYLRSDRFSVVLGGQTWCLPSAPSIPVMVLVGDGVRDRRAERAARTWLGRNPL